MVLDWNQMFKPAEDEFLHREHNHVHAHEPNPWDSGQGANKLHPEKKKLRQRQKAARKANRRR